MNKNAFAPGRTVPLDVVGEFTPAMLETLRAEFSKIERIDIHGKSWENFTALLDRLPDAHLLQVAEAGIKFASNTAGRRLRIRGYTRFIVDREARTHVNPVSFWAKSFFELANRLGCQVQFAAPGHGMLFRRGTETFFHWNS